MRLMGMEAVYRRPRTSVAGPEHRVFPYLLRGLSISRADHVWCADITYIPVTQGFFHLVAVMDWATHTENTGQVPQHYQIKCTEDFFSQSHKVPKAISKKLPGKWNRLRVVPRHGAKEGQKGAKPPTASAGDARTEWFAVRR